MVVRDRTSDKTYSIPLDYFRKFYVLPRRPGRAETMQAYKAKFPEGKIHAKL